MRALLTFTTLFFVLLGYSQKPLYVECAGPIPNDILEYSYTQYEKDVGKELSKDNRKRIERAQERRVLNNTYFLEAIFNSGRVLFGDSITQLLNNIKNRLAIPDSLKQRIHIYTIKAPDPNAFCTLNGRVFIHTGLIANLRNEDELAFVVAHEIGHYVKRHSLRGVKHALLKIKEGSDDKKSFDWFLEQIAKRSRKDEKEADVYALETLKISEFNLKRAEGAFTHLLDMDTLNFERTDLSVGDYHFPKELKKQAFTINEDSLHAKDKYASHPARKERLEIFRQYVSSLPGNNGASKNQEWLNRVSVLAERINVRLLNDVGSHHEALWYAVRSGDQSRTMLRNKVRSVYELGCISDILQVETLGSFNLTNWSLLKLGTKQLLCLVVLQSVEALKNYPEDVYLTNVRNDALKRLLSRGLNVEYTQYKAGKFYIETETYHSLLLKWLSASAGKFNLSMKSETRTNLDSVNFVGGSRFKKNLGISKVLLVQPRWEFLDNRQGARSVYSEHKTIEYLNILKENADLCGLQQTTLSSKHLGAKDVNKLNDIYELNSWADHRMLSAFLGVLYPDPEKMQRIKGKYGCSDVAWIDVMTYRRKKSAGETFGWIAQSVLVINAPITMYQAFKAEYHSVFGVRVANIDSGNISYYDVNYIKTKTNRSLLNSYLYAYFKTMMPRD